MAGRESLGTRFEGGLAEPLSNQETIETQERMPPPALARDLRRPLAGSRLEGGRRCPARVPGAAPDAICTRAPFRVLGLMSAPPRR